MSNSKLILGDCLEEMKKIPSDSIDCIVTSPPYNKTGIVGKKTKVGNQIWNKFNIEYETYGDNMPEEMYRTWMVNVIDEMVRVIKSNGSIFFNHKPRRFKNQAYLPTDFISRSKAKLYQLIIWDRRNSPNIRADILVPCTEHVYWLCKDKPKVFRNHIPMEYRGEVWVIPPQKQKGHPAPFPEQLASNCILLSTRKNDTVLDPFMGSGTTGIACKNNDRKFIGIEIDKKYYQISQQNIGA